MSQDGTTAIERFARTQHATAARWLRRSFGAKLTEEDVSDVLGKVYEEALANASHLEDQELRPWFYTAARHRAIDAVRRMEGEGSSPRSVVTLSDEPAFDLLTTDDGETRQALLDEDARVAEALLVHRALEALPPAEREVLRLSAVDGLSIRATADLLGLSKKVVETTRTRAHERFKSLIGAPVDEACGRARALIQPGRLVDPDLARWRDAHLSGCIGCQVQGDRAYGKRLQGLAPLLPVAYPTAGRIEALMNRLGGLPPEAAAVGVTSGLGGGGAMAGLFGAGGGVKLAVAAAACATAAACVSVTGAAKPEPRPEPQPATAQVPTVRPDTQPVRLIRPTPTPRPTVESSKRRAERRATRRPRAARATQAGKEFSPESFASAPAPTPRPSVPRTPAATQSGSGSPPTSSSSSPSSGDAFAGEFAP